MISPADFYAFEQHFETALAALLQEAKFNVRTPFLRQLGTAADGSPILETSPDDACFVLAEFAGVDDSILGTLTDPDEGVTSEDANFTVLVDIIHRVPVDDRPPEVGTTAVTYARLCAQRGRVRALIRNGYKRIQAALPMYDLQSITLSAPERTMDNQKLAFQATEKIRITFTARDDLPN